MRRGGDAYPTSYLAALTSASAGQRRPGERPGYAPRVDYEFPQPRLHSAIGLCAPCAGEWTCRGCWRRAIVLAWIVQLHRVGRDQIAAGVSRGDQSVIRESLSPAYHPGRRRPTSPLPRCARDAVSASGRCALRPKSSGAAQLAASLHSQSAGDVAHAEARRGPAHQDRGFGEPTV